MTVPAATVPAVVTAAAAAAPTCCCVALIQQVLVDGHDFVAIPCILLLLATCIERHQACDDNTTCCECETSRPAAGVRVQAYPHPRGYCSTQQTYKNISCCTESQPHWPTISALCCVQRKAVAVAGPVVGLIASIAKGACAARVILHAKTCTHDSPLCEPTGSS
jgi:hypothetical protein